MGKLAVLRCFSWINDVFKGVFMLFFGRCNGGFFLVFGAFFFFFFLSVFFFFFFFQQKRRQFVFFSSFFSSLATQNSYFPVKKYLKTTKNLLFRPFFSLFLGNFARKNRHYGP
eukprot:TRINITY_DN2769_c1_g1_i8.p1 TRINITY_DN2769_c1_g1~~TRINITY_DN2769_c1_g1_i8.p1  ORF type:complete len:113 (-),score=59.62 TRINITY_DN2769_c1_g1_i8:224-562(-)